MDTSAELKRFIEDLACTRIEAVSPPTSAADKASIAAALGASQSSFATRAATLLDGIGWPIVTGFILFQVTGEDAYVAEVRQWNAKPVSSGSTLGTAWVYAPAHDAPVLAGEKSGTVLLCESALAQRLLDGD